MPTLLTMRKAASDDRYCEAAENEVKPRLKGAAHEIRFADDAVLCFQYREDAEKVMEVLPKRFAKYGLTLHREKTRLVDFGRYAEEHAKWQGKKPATFDFLGFTHICARSRRGKFMVNTKTIARARDSDAGRDVWASKFLVARSDVDGVETLVERRATGIHGLRNHVKSSDPGCQACACRTARRHRCTVPLKLGMNGLVTYSFHKYC